MCGIAGFIDCSSDFGPWTEILTQMARTIVHRGPDDQGLWYEAANGVVGMAHRRLSIIDLSPEGRQPMESSSGRYAIVFNGEIYNFGEIKEMLRQENIMWRGHSDTEVMLEALDKWGFEKAIEKFIGMFAFGLWDKSEQALYLCRDRMGIKPLYYASIPNGIIFASEMKALMAHPKFHMVIDPNVVSLFLRHNCIPAPYSIFKNTWKLKPGHFLRISKDRMANGMPFETQQCYWALEDVALSGQQSILPASLEEATEQLEGLIENAVRLRMISDVPLGAFLSGGVDSSTIAALMQRRKTNKIKTYSIGFTDMGFNEAEFAKAVAGHLGTDHTELYVSSSDALNIIPELPRFYDEPFADSSQIPSLLLAKMTRKHVTVALSGDGGDELFGGYNRYQWGVRLNNLLRRTPVRLRKTICYIIQKISPLQWDKWLYPIISSLPQKYRIDTPGDRIHKLCGALSSRDLDQMYRNMVSHWEIPGDIVNNGHEYGTEITNPKSASADLDPIHRMMFFDQMTYLPDDILTKVDRATMAVGLEARVPFLDHRVVAFAWQLPLHFKLDRQQAKKIVRKILYKYVPKAIIDRPKTGFAIPLHRWLREDLRDWAEDLLSLKNLKEGGIFNPEPIRRKWTEHLSGRFNWQYHLWDILMFQAWKAHYHL